MAGRVGEPVKLDALHEIGQPWKLCIGFVSPSHELRIKPSVFTKGALEDCCHLAASIDHGY